ncbi:signal peptidase II [Buchnera aphidicola]|uniref:signal peptidase II n=1 Tax=Buchnera aphidicola TaxID=9 RepID=UPI003464CFAB
MEKNVILYKKLYIIFTVCAIDFLSKFLVSKYYTLYSYKKIFFIINFFYLKNYGIIFNIFSNSTKIEKLSLIIISFIIITILFQKNIKKKNLSYTLILSGALSNIINKIYCGFIIDFIDIQINMHHIIIFNIADISIIIGSIMIIYN